MMLIWYRYVNWKLIIRIQNFFTNKELIPQLHILNFYLNHWEFRIKNQVNIEVTNLTQLWIQIVAQKFFLFWFILKRVLVKANAQVHVGWVKCKSSRNASIKFKKSVLVDFLKNVFKKSLDNFSVRSVVLDFFSNFSFDLIDICS